MPTRTMSRIAAVQAAARALNELHFDQSQPIDPFEAIHTLGLELQFRPMKDLLGAILPGSPAGVLINSERPASMQRYTAAHEIAHWYLHQDALAIDLVQQIDGHTDDLREQNAQLFASHFLMPLELFHATAARHGITKGAKVSPLAAYGLARDMHVSYIAAVHQLSNLHFISGSLRNELLRVPLAQLKRVLTDGRKPVNIRGDVWPIDRESADSALEVFVGDEIVVSLPENPSTGYRWLDPQHARSAGIRTLRPAPAAFDAPGERASWSSETSNVIAMPVPLRPVLTLVADNAASDAPATDELPIVGGRTTRHLAYSANEPGDGTLQLNYLRPFAPQNPSDSIQVHATVRALPDQELRDRLIREFLQEEAAAQSDTPT